MTSGTNMGHHAAIAAGVFAAAILAGTASRCVAAGGEATETFTEVFGKGATGADVRQTVIAEIDNLQKTLEEKRKAGTLTDEEREIAGNLPDARRRLESADGAAFDKIAQLASGETVTIDIPSGEQELPRNEHGEKKLTFSAADLEKAQRDAQNLATKAGAYASSPEGNGMAAAVNGGSLSAGGASGTGGAAETTIATATGTENGYYVSVFVGNGEDGGAGGADVDVLLDMAPFEVFDWVYGGFHGDKAKSGDVIISDVKFKSDGLSFKWVKDLSQWGVANEDYTQALACLFVMNKDGKWVGGKFDWISSSRSTRDFANIYSGYNDWSLENVPNPCPAAFVVVSKDGKKRSNVIGGMWQR